MQKRKVKGMPVIECIFFLIKVLKDYVRLTINSYLLSFFCCPPPPPTPPIAISVLAQCEQNLKQFYCSILPSIE